MHIVRYTSGKVPVAYYHVIVVSMQLFTKPIIVEAHCDIPCGVYDPTPAKIAARTVSRMVDQLQELSPPADTADRHALLSYIHSSGRRIAVKEEHAALCKRELEILWSDFFKPEHLIAYPDLHNIFWKAVKLCSKNKQEISKAAAGELIAVVDAIAKIFYAVKGDPARFDAYRAITDSLY